MRLLLHVLATVHLSISCAGLTHSVAFAVASSELHSDTETLFQLVVPRDPNLTGHSLRIIWHFSYTTCRLNVKELFEMLS